MSFLSPVLRRLSRRRRANRPEAFGCDVVIVEPSGIEYRSRAQKIARTILRNGLSVAFLTKLPPSHRGAVPVATRLFGCPVIQVPDAHSALPRNRRRSPAANWLGMVDGLAESMWPYVEMARPAAIHTLHAAGIAVGDRLRERLAAHGHRTLWIHDFTEYAAGHAYGDDRIADWVPDDEWRNAVIELEARHAARPDHSFAVSEALSAAVAAEYRLPRSPVPLLNAPWFDDFDANARPTLRQVVGLAAETPLLVYLGGVTPLRGLDTLVAAVARLDQAHLAILTGTRTPYLDSLLGEARRLGCGQRIHLLPRIEPHRVASFIRDATLGVHPLKRYPNAEVALPNKLFDYLHAGLPTVASDCAAMAEFVQRHDIGKVFRAGSAEHLAATLGEMIEARDAYGRRITPELRRRFSWETQERALLEPYAAAIDAKRRADAGVSRAHQGPS